MKNTLPPLKLPSGSSPRGAQMGRCNQFPKDPWQPCKLQMERLRWVDGDYDQWGAYWGYTSGTAIYCAWGFGTLVFVRDTSREAAKQTVRELVPGARFYR
jgi:hypothetical protein